MVLSKVLKTISCIIGLVLYINLSAQTPAQQLSKYVDPFTGDFNYNVPLVEIGGPNGEAFPLNLSYSGGIAATQQASWVGLGWNLNLGEISRQVKGVPDDAKNVVSHNVIRDADDANRYFGPLYFPSAYGATGVGNTRLDMYIGIENGEFTFPDYDNYYVSGPGIGAEMRPFLFDYAEIPTFPSIVPDGGSTTYRSTIGANYLPPGATPATYLEMRKFTKKPQFRFLNEPMAELKNKISTLNANGTNGLGTYKAPVIPGGNYPFWGFPIPGITTNTTSSNSNNNWFNRSGQTNNRDASNYVEYFTNDEIHNNYTGTAITGFLDFKPFVIGVDNSDRDDNVKYDPNGIGAFRVTAPDGKVYHYSLPVYMRDEVFTSFGFSNNWNIVGNIKKNYNSNKYAYTWKLTAITDYTYEDTNGNHYPDEGDKGYWISINYTKWSDKYTAKIPYYGFNADAPNSGRTPNNTEANVPYSAEGSFSESTPELYYPEFIKTSTQTAYFIKGIRDDNHGVSVGAGSNYVPKLYLKSVLLMDNEDVADNNIFSTPQAVTSTAYTNLSANANTTNTLSIEDYNYYKTDVDKYALKTIEFEFDYHLAKKLYNNINNTYTETPVNSEGTLLFNNASNPVTANPDLSGKLSLNKLTMYELNREQFLPEHVFEYNSNNPDFNHDRHDMFGYYQDSYNHASRSRYITDDHGMVDAWSLTKITSLGGVINVAYESDTYTGVVYDGVGELPYKPSRVFEIESVDFAGTASDPKYTALNIADPDVDFYYPLANRKEVFFKHSCCSSAKIDNMFDGSLTTFNGFLSKISTTNSFTQQQLCGYGTPLCNNPTFANGYLYLVLDEVYGGGTRVKTISITDPLSSNSYKLNYEYTDGIATTEPDAYEKVQGFELIKSYWSSDRHAMAPNVGYSKTKMIIGDDADNSGSTEYTFRNTAAIKTLAGSPVIHFTQVGPSPNSGSVINYNHYTVQDDRSIYGRINSVTNMDNKGHVVSKSNYYYGSNAIDPRGMVEEVFFDFNKIDNGLLKLYKQRIYMKKMYNTHLIKEVQIKDGMKTTNLFTKRDNLTGVPIYTALLTPTGNIIQRDEMVYTSEPGMGAKTSDSNNDNLLLSKKESTLDYQIGGSSTNWSNNLVTRSWDAINDKYTTTVKNSIWSPVEILTYNTGFNWKKESTNSLFGSREGKFIIEQKDVKDAYTAIKNGYDERYKIAEVKNCNYTSFAFSSFESTKEVEPGVYHFSGEVEKTNGVQVNSFGNIKSHTGEHMVEVPVGQIGPLFKSTLNNVIVNGELFERGIQAGRTYRASVWVHKNSPNESQLVFKLDGNVTAIETMRRDDPEAIQIGNWIQLNLTFSVPGNYVSSGGVGDNDFRVYLENLGTSGSAYFDDLVIHPVDAQFTGYVMDKRLGLVMAVINNENFYSRFKYDNAGNLIATYKETAKGEKVISTNTYQYK